MANSFVCSICGKHHEGHTTDWAYKLPDEVWAIPDHVRVEQARFNDDLCQWGERYFIRCLLAVPFTEMDGDFGWGAWAEVEWSTFERYLELYDADGNSEPMKLGKLANALRPYAGSMGTDMYIQFRDPTKRPSLFILPENSSLLGMEQRNGIDNTRFHDILGLLEGAAASD